MVTPTTTAVTMVTPTTAAVTMVTPTTAAVTMVTPTTAAVTMVTPATVTPATVTPATATPATVTPATVTPATATPATVTPAATTAAPVITNLTVETLDAPINRADCGSQQLCAAEPSACDPSATGSCFFVAARQQSGQNFEFGLSGESDGYIAASLGTENSQQRETAYVCANNNGGVQIFGAALASSGVLTITTQRVNSVRGRVDGRTIQCTFVATVPDSSTRAAGFALRVSNGTFNPDGNVLGTSTTQIRTSVIDLTNPNANITNVFNHAITLQQSLLPALLVALGVLGLSVL
ncbi:putative ferric-chelate reductase 1 [Brachyistius frenatus]|uniref:putative ferric-chelate reductase 1 n=1 Tax=Brachyistius frenatus TaxID=100188 RepID=UPI0037E8CF5B